MRRHPLVLEHAALLVRVAALSDEECARRGGADAYADLWEVLEAGMPLVALEVPASTRRARKQLLFRLSKQPAAAHYETVMLPETVDGDAAAARY